MGTHYLGTLGSTPIHRNNYNLSTSDPTDVFKFNIQGTQNIYLNLHDITSGDDADLYLYRDSNQNGFLDSGDEKLDQSRRGGNQEDDIDFLATEGTYFAEVERYAPGSSGNVTYDLEISQNSPGPSNNLLPADVNVGSPSGTRTFNDSVGNSDPSDIYRFELFSVGSNFEYVDISLTGLANNADMRVIQDRNNNGIAESNEVVAISTNGGISSEQITGVGFSYDSSPYYLQVYQTNGNTPYTVEFEFKELSF
ncbi:MAG: pre-peptidase C-terminal domain-containing protein [Cyanobacteria bacterium J06635_15]